MGEWVRGELQRQAAGLTSDEHFSVDGTLIESHASIKSFVPKGRKDDGQDAGGFKSRNPEVDFHGQKRSNATHASRTDPEARLFKKANGQPAKLYHTAYAIAENRHGLVVAVELTDATGDAEPAATLAMVDAIRSTHGRPVRTLQDLTDARMLGAARGLILCRLPSELRRWRPSPDLVGLPNGLGRSTRCSSSSAYSASAAPANPRRPTR